MKFRDETGYVLATALGAIILVTAIALASYAVSQRAMEHAISNSDASRAYQIASSALEYEVSRYERGGAIASQNGKTLPTGETYSLTSNMVDGTLTLTCTAQVGDQRESVSANYETATGLTDTIYSGAGNLFQAASMNGQSKVFGALYMKLSAKDKVTSNPEFYDGPLMIEGAGSFKGGARFGTTPNCQSDDGLYHAYTESAQTLSGSSNVVVEPLTTKLTQPKITPETEEAYRKAAKANNRYYPGPLTISAANGFAIDGNGKLVLNGVCFAEGPISVSSEVKGYEGNFTLYSKSKIVVDGRLVPANYALGATPAPGSFDPSYSPYLDARDAQIPVAREYYCASLVTPGTVNLNWAMRSNANYVFSFCGVIYSMSTISFQESLRGTIIAVGGLLPNKRTILATQLNINEFLPDITSGLLNGTLARGYWVRGK